MTHIAQRPYAHTRGAAIMQSSTQPHTALYIASSYQLILPLHILIVSMHITPGPLSDRYHDNL